MLGVRVICVGRLKEKHYIDACAEYEKRLSRYCAFDLVEVPETGDLAKDGAAVLAKIPAGAYVVALCIEGKLHSSQELAELVQQCAVGGKSKICFLIGGSDGLADAVKNRSERRLSMSRMTFPHHLARVMVMEQIYRAFTIIEGGKYHK